MWGRGDDCIGICAGRQGGQVIGVWIGGEMEKAFVYIQWQGGDGIGICAWGGMEKALVYMLGRWRWVGVNGVWEVVECVM